ncbi:MAG: hypothetical protein K8S98_15605 [Planctomycetes bacterium]|nr:hypothetical protein [Planctomycetota bacterium]
MAGLWNDVDRLLRGEHTQGEQLRTGKMGVSTWTLVLACLVLGALYGVCMGLYPALYTRPDGVLQLASTTVKVPLLFLATLLVTYPSLYVFSALANSRLRFRETLRLLLASTAVNLAVLASLGPVTAFFTLSTRSHAFMQLLNAAFFTIAGCVGLTFLWRAMREVYTYDPVAPIGGVERVRPRAGRVLAIWLMTYAIVGAQMGWILRPFVGAPNLPFQWLRGPTSNIFRGLLEALRFALE